MEERCAVITQKILCHILMIQTSSPVFSFECWWIYTLDWDRKILWLEMQFNPSNITDLCFCVTSWSIILEICFRITQKWNIRLNYTVTLPYCIKIWTKFKDCLCNFTVSYLVWAFLFCALLINYSVNILYPSIRNT